MYFSGGRLISHINLWNMHGHIILVIIINNSIFFSLLSKYLLTTLSEMLYKDF